MKFTDAEKLILLMLCDVQEHLKIKGSTNIDLVRSAIYEGHLWSLKASMEGVFHDSEPTDEVRRQTTDILAMWQRLEESFDELSNEEKVRVSMKVNKLAKRSASLVSMETTKQITIRPPTLWSPNLAGFVALRNAT